MLPSGAKSYLQQYWRELYAKYREHSIRLQGSWCLPAGSNRDVCIDVVGEEKSAAYLESNERAVFTDLLSEVGEEDVFWDIGAHKGLYSILVSEK